MKNKPTVIDLTLSRNSHPFLGKNLLWDPELGRIFEMLAEHHNILKNGSSLDRHIAHGRPRSLLSISLHGSYGSGKSSLLRTLMAIFRDPGDSGQSLTVKNDFESDFAFDDHFNNIKSHIFSLPVIQPAMKGQANRFLYSFLASALEEDINKQRDKHSGHQRSQILTPLQRQFQDVSVYLQAVDQEETRHEADSLGVSIARLENHSSHLRLQEKLSEFISRAAESLSRDKDGIILMPVDDADMSKDALISTLDVYRHYLQHPQLVPVFTFTGRLAEELLCTYFEEELGERRNKLTEAATGLSIVENLAIQYLGKLFPIRNRIRLGSAAARVQAAQYRAGSGSHDKGADKRQIYKLLSTASRLLFGFSDRPLIPEVRTALRSSSLRRQLQLVDVLSAAKLGDWIDKPEDPHSWGQTFDRTTWSLLNVHRDVLKEYDLNIDDLYSWTPRGLQNVILRAILKRPLAARRDLLNSWRYRAEDRRVQMLSLLAANAFRPTMLGEDPNGDDLEAIASLANSRSKEEFTAAAPKHPIDRSTFSLRKGCYWFLNLWHGFYLPQLLARNRLSSEEIKERKMTDVDPLSSVGWSLRNAPINAMREALKERHARNTGMQLLDEKIFSRWVDRLAELTQVSRQERTLEFPTFKRKVVFQRDEAGMERHAAELEKYLRFIRWFRYQVNHADAKEVAVERPGKSLDPKRVELFHQLGIKLVDNRIYHDHLLDYLQTCYEAFVRHDDWVILLPQIWCFFGTERDEPWAAISFWRGLGLLGNLLKAEIDWQGSSLDTDMDQQLEKMTAADIAPAPTSDSGDDLPRQTGGSCSFKELRTFEDQRNYRIQDIIWKHLKASKIIGTPSKNGNFLRNTKRLRDYASFAEFGNWRFGNIKLLVQHLSLAFEFWLERFSASRYRINPMEPLQDAASPDSASKKPTERDQWKSCFTRRIHGENLIGLCWQKLEQPDLHAYGPDWTALKPLEKWCTAMSKYWNCGTENQDSAPFDHPNEKRVRRLLLASPILAPFSCELDQFESQLDDIVKVVRKVGRADEEPDKEPLLVYLKHVTRSFEDAEWDQSIECEWLAALGEKPAQSQGTSEPARSAKALHEMILQSNAWARGNGNLNDLFGDAREELRKKIFPDENVSTDPEETGGSAERSRDLASDKLMVLASLRTYLQVRMTQSIEKLYRVTYQVCILKRALEALVSEFSLLDTQAKEKYTNVLNRIRSQKKRMLELFDSHYNIQTPGGNREEANKIPLTRLAAHLLDIPVRQIALQGESTAALTAESDRDTKTNDNSKNNRQDTPEAEGKGGQDPDTPEHGS